MSKLELLPDAGIDVVRVAGRCLVLHGGTSVTVHDDRQVEIDLARVWRELTQGRTTIVDVFATSRHCYLVLEPRGREVPSHPDLSPSRVRMLEWLLLGNGRKGIALDLGVNDRTVTGSIGRVLRAMGLRCLLSRIPMALYTLVHAAHEKTDVSKGMIGPFEAAGEYRMLGLERVDGCLDYLLSPAEAAVARLFIEGHSHAEIASARSTARHTIANQLTATFQKLSVSGRADLLCMLHDSARARRIRATLAAEGVRSEMRRARGQNTDGASLVPARLN